MKRLSVALWLALWLALPVSAQMYKWVDAQGNVQYSDTLPPAAAGRGNAEISKAGQTVRKTESAEEKRARLVREAEAAQQKNWLMRRSARIVRCYPLIRSNRKSTCHVTAHWNITVWRSRVRKFVSNQSWQARRG